MFGLTRREQRWAAEQKVAETVIPAIVELAKAKMMNDQDARIAALEHDLREARAERDTALTDAHDALADLAEARAEVERLRATLNAARLHIIGEALPTRDQVLAAIDAARSQPCE